MPGSTTRRSPTGTRSANRVSSSRVVPRSGSATAGQFNGFEAPFGAGGSGVDVRLLVLRELPVSRRSLARVILVPAIRRMIATLEARRGPRRSPPHPPPCAARAGGAAGRGPRRAGVDLLRPGSDRVAAILRDLITPRPQPPSPASDDQAAVDAVVTASARNLDEQTASAGHDHPWDERGVASAAGTTAPGGYAEWSDRDGAPGWVPVVGRSAQAHNLVAAKCLRSGTSPVGYGLLCVCATGVERVTRLPATPRSSHSLRHIETESDGVAVEMVRWWVVARGGRQKQEGPARDAQAQTEPSPGRPCLLPDRADPFEGAD